MKIKPYKHQLDAFEFIKNKNQFALFMDMGTGKSLVILMKLFYLIEKNEIDKCLIIAPNYLKYSWIEDHFEPFFDTEFNYYIYNSSGFNSKKEQKKYKDFCNLDNFKVLIVNVELFQTKNADRIIKQFLIDRRAMIIIDESIIIKNPKAQRTIKIVNGFKFFEYKAILSGTPTPNSPSDLYSQFDFLKQFFFQCNYFQFKHKYTIFTKQTLQNGIKYDAVLTEKDYRIIKNKLNKTVLTADYINELSHRYNISESNIIRINKMAYYTPYKDLEKLNEKISCITYKIKKEDCLDLPDKVFEKLIVELNSEQKRIYKELTNNFFSIYDENQLSVSNTLSLITRLKMITSGLFPCHDLQNLDFDNLDNINLDNYKIVKRIDKNPKIKALIDDIESVDNSVQIIVWSYFVECIKYIYDEIKKYYSCEKYFGETKNRNEIIQSYKNNEFKILIANPMVAGMGLNLQNSTLSYFFDNGYRADLRLQAEDRPHRLGQVNKVVYKDIIAKGTIDERIYEIIKNKMDLISFFKDKNNLKEVLFNEK